MQHPSHPHWHYSISVCHHLTPINTGPRTRWPDSAPVPNLMMTSPPSTPSKRYTAKGYIRPLCFNRHINRRKSSPPLRPMGAAAATSMGGITGSRTRGSLSQPASVVVVVSRRRDATTRPNLHLDTLLTSLWCGAGLSPLFLWHVWSLRCLHGFFLVIRLYSILRWAVVVLKWCCGGCSWRCACWIWSDQVMTQFYKGCCFRLW